MGFTGEGKTLEDTADDACRKLVSYIESRIRGGWPPFHRQLIAAERDCLSSHGKFLAEKDLEENEGRGEMQWGTPVDFDVFAEVTEGIVKQVGWREKSCDSWFVWKEPGFSSLD